MQAANILSALIPGLTPQGAAASASGPGLLGGADGVLGGLFGDQTAEAQSDNNPFADALASVLGAAMQAVTPVQPQPTQPTQGETIEAEGMPKSAAPAPATPFMISAAADAVAQAAPVETQSVEPVLAGPQPVQPQIQPAAVQAAPVQMPTPQMAGAVAPTVAPQPVVTEMTTAAPIKAVAAAADVAQDAVATASTAAEAQPAPPTKTASVDSPKAAPLPAPQPQAQPAAPQVAAPPAPAVALAAAPAQAQTEPTAPVEQAVAAEEVQAPTPAPATPAKTATRSAAQATSKARATEPQVDPAARAVQTAEAAPVKPTDDGVDVLGELALSAVKAKDTEDKPAPLADKPAADPALAAAQAAPTQAQASDAPKITAHTVAHLAAQVVQKSEGGKSTRFDVVLNPEGLGKVDVQIEIGAKGDVIAQMNFDNPEAASQMKARAGELQAALTQAGFDADKTSLSFNSGGASQDGLWRQDGGDQGGSRPSWTGRAFSQIADEADAAAMPVAWTRRGAAGGVDVRI